MSLGPKKGNKKKQGERSRRRQFNQEEISDSHYDQERNSAIRRCSQTKKIRPKTGVGLSKINRQFT